MHRQRSTMHDFTSFPTWRKVEINVRELFCSLQSRQQGEKRIGEDPGFYSRAIGDLQEEEDGRISDENTEISRQETCSIENPEVQRIAQVLDRIKSKERYVIVPDVIKPLTLKDIKTAGPIKLITFGTTRPYKRTMQVVSNPEDYLSNVLEALRIVFSGCLIAEV